jgi:hypothetical protein
VGDEHVVDLGQPDGAHELALRPLPTVEQQTVAAAAHEQGGQPAPGGGHRAGRAGEEHVEVHGAA